MNNPESVSLEESSGSNKNDALSPSQELSMEDKIKLLGGLEISLIIEVGRTQMKMQEVLELKKGSVIELDKQAGEPVEIYASGKKLGTGDIITANGRYCVRVTSIMGSAEK